MCKQFSKSQHQAVDKRQNDVDRSPSQDTPERRRVVEDQG